MTLVMPMSVEVELTSNDPNRRVSATESHFSTKMYYYGREICFILAIIFTSYAALHNGTPKVSKSPSAVPFFTRTSVVTDFYHGQLVPAFERVSESDISFVMYYAPWDAESQALRPHFKAVAQYYYQQVYFAAINCWQPLSECRQQFSKIQMFPVLIAYTQQTKGVQYKGVKEAGHMIRFLHHLLNPVRRVHTTADLVQMMSQHDAVVVGFFQFLGSLGGHGYHTFYTSSLKMLERDAQREIGFAAVTDEATARQWAVYQTPAVRIYMWNETLEYGQGDEYTPEALCKWISDRTHQVSVWVSPPGVKSLTLAPYVDEGPVLVLFTPRNPLLASNHNYELLREVGLEYYNCDGNPWVTDLTKWLAALRADQPEMYSTMERDCSAVAELPTGPLVSTVSLAGANVSCDRRRKLDARSPVLEAGRCGHEADDDDDEFLPPPDESVSESHSHLRVDPRSSAALTESSRSEHCRMFRRAIQLHRARFPRPVVDGVESPSAAAAGVDVRGLACRGNRSLSLLAMDSLQFAHFAAGLGADLTAASGRDKTAAVIVDSHDESSYSLAGEVSKASLTRFIADYTAGRLTRSLRSSDGDQLNAFPVTAAADCRLSRSTACVRELTSDTFQSVVMDPSQSVVLMYHSPFCAFCSGVSHVFLTTARHFRSVANLTFARIDGESNDLPWQYTMHHYPTVLFFPAKRKSDSRVYPGSLPTTVPNLVHFVLANLGSGYSRLQGLIGLCSGWSRAHDPHAARDCLDLVRGECLHAVADTLAEYRSAVFRWRVAQASSLSRRALAQHRDALRSRSKRLLFKLQHLKQVQLLLGATDCLTEGGREFVAIQRSFRLYQNELVEEHDRSESAVSRTSVHIKDEL